jgi:hypothetical protein
MNVRLFAMRGTRLLTRRSDLYDSPGDYNAYQKLHHPDRVVLAWEEGDRPGIEDEAERLHRCREALAGGQSLHYAATALLDAYLKGASITATTVTPAAPAIGPRKPPKTVIVQEWVKTVPAEELAARAWAATMAIAKGG